MKYFIISISTIVAVIGFALFMVELQGTRLFSPASYMSDMILMLLGFTMFALGAFTVYVTVLFIEKEEHTVIF